MPKILRYYFAFSSLLFLITILRLMKSKNLLLSIYLGIGLNPKNYLITFNFFICAAVAFFIKVKKAMIGDETESMRHFVSDNISDFILFICVFLCTDYQYFFPFLYFGILFYIALLLLAKVTSLYVSTKYPPKKQHYFLMFGELLLFCISLASVCREAQAKSSKALLTAHLNCLMVVSKSIIFHILYIFDYDMMGNSKSTEVAKMYLELFFDILIILCKVPLLYMDFILMKLIGFAHLITDSAIAGKHYMNLLFYLQSAQYIKNLPSVTDKDLEREEICLICRGNLQADFTCKRLPCGHCYHSSCIEAWIRNYNTCPLCNAAVLPERKSYLNDILHRLAEHHNDNDANIQGDFEEQFPLPEDVREQNLIIPDEVNNDVDPDNLLEIREIYVDQNGNEIQFDEDGNPYRVTEDGEIIYYKFYRFVGDEEDES